MANHYKELIDHLESLCSDIRAASKARGTAGEVQTKQQLDTSLESFIPKATELVNLAKSDREGAMIVFNATHVDAGPSAVTIGQGGQLVNAATGTPLGVDSGLTPGEVSTVQPTGIAAPPVDPTAVPKNVDAPNPPANLGTPPNPNDLAHDLKNRR